jgi:hypothetical protein
MQDELFKKAQDAARKIGDAANAIRAAQEAQRVAQEAQSVAQETQRAAEAEFHATVQASEWVHPLQLVVPNKNPGGEPVTASIEDMATHAEDPKPVFKSADLLSHEELLTALTDPVLGPKNFEAIWGNALSYKAWLNGKYHEQPHIRDIAENRSILGLAITTLWVRYQDDIVPVHVMMSNKLHGGVIVGEMAPLSLCDKFKKAGIRYINRHTFAGAAGIQMALEGLTRGVYMPNYAFDNVAEAFELRNPKDGRSLPVRMKDRKLKPTCPKYVVKNKKPAV